MEDLLAVLSHGWLNSVAVIKHAASGLAVHGEGLDDERRAEMIDLIREQVQFITDELSVFVDAADPKLRGALEAFNRD